MFLEQYLLIILATIYLLCTLTVRFICILSLEACLPKAARCTSLTERFFPN
jgi:hypothetical protein